MKKIIILILLSFAGLAASATQYKLEENIRYSKNRDAYSQERCYLHVYYPVDMKDAPVLVWLHGGGLTGGNTFVPQHLMESGMVIVAVNYRLMPKVGIADCIDDAAASVAWAFENAEKYNGNAKKVYVCGHSAGGYLASMVALDRKYLQKYGKDADRIAAVIPLSGQAITHFAQRNLQGIPALQATIDEFAPLYHVRGDAAPFIIVSGDREMEMNGRYEEQAYFWRMLKLSGMKDARLYEIQGFDHGAMCNPGFHIVKQYVK